jgi:hypothetical protein
MIDDNIINYVLQTLRVQVRGAVAVSTFFSPQFDPVEPPHSPPIICFPRYAETVLVPLFYARHWSLAVYDQKNSRVTVYDSLPDYHASRRNEIVRRLVEYMGREGVDGEVPRMPLVVAHTEVVTWFRQEVNDCGLAVVRHAAFALGLPNPEAWGRVRLERVFRAAWTGPTQEYAVKLVKKQKK